MKGMESALKVILLSILFTFCPIVLKKIAAQNACFLFSEWYMMDGIANEFPGEFIMPGSLPYFLPGVPPGEQLFFFAQAAEQSPVSMVITQQDMTIVYVNERYSRLTGYKPEELVGQKASILKSGLTPLKTYQDMRTTLAAGQAWRGEFHNRKKNSDLYWEFALISPLKNQQGEITHYLGLLEDLSERQRTVTIFEYMANHDSLTDLPNQVYFQAQLERALAARSAQSPQLAVILLDIDRFKIITETLGHSPGDGLLCALAERLVSALPKNMLVSRRGGDEFLILLPGIEHFQTVVKTAQQILTLFQEPFQQDGNRVHLTASLGISLAPEDGSTVQALLQSADAALYDAKDAGRNNYKFFKLKNFPESFERLSLENDLRTALERQEMRVFYQPQVSLDSGKIVGMEALVRWQHPQHGLLAPVHFIPLAEETGLIVPLGLWILTMACDQCRTWQKAGYPPLRLAVNLSARQFLQPELVESILHILMETDLEPRFLELEITESILMKDINMTILILRWLKKKGIQIAVDDFGTGYSSLTYLNRFPIDTLKIDQSFVRDCPNNSDNATLVSAIRSLAKALHLRVIAEGVETAEQLEFLSGLRGEEIQGFYFSRPVPPDEFEQLLRDGKQLPARIGPESSPRH